MEEEFKKLEEGLVGLKSKCIQSDLIGLGFSKTLLKKYYPNPKQKKITNTKFYYLYNVDDIKTIIASEEFKQDFSNTVKKSIIGKTKAKETKDKNLEIVKNVDITIEKISFEQLKKLAIKYWEDFNERVWNNISIKYTNRLMINYVRHNLTVYHELLDFNNGKIGKQEMYEILKEKINQKILEVYPQLGILNDNQRNV